MNTIGLRDGGQPPRGEAIHNRYYAFEHLAQGSPFIRASSHVADISRGRGVLLVMICGGLCFAIASTRSKKGRRGGRLLLSRSALLSNPKLQSWSV